MKFSRKLAGIFLLSAVWASPAVADRASVTAATYSGYSMSAPTRDFLTVCHGFGCQYRAELVMTSADHAALTKLMAAGKASPEKERAAIGAAGAWFDKRIAAVAGTTGHVARANRDHMFDSGQFDCIDSSRNMTSLLLVLDELGLLRFHAVEEPEARGHIVDFRPPHVTAVLAEKSNGTKWSVDAWTRAYAQAPEIMLLNRWMDLD